MHEVRNDGSDKLVEKGHFLPFQICLEIQNFQWWGLYVQSS
jgi:hypothetical protein